MKTKQALSDAKTSANEKVLREMRILQCKQRNLFCFNDNLSN